MQEHFLYVPYLHHHRRIRVLLPKDYHNEGWERYPVLYMHDGQNVFYSKESYSGHSWKIIPTIKSHQELPKMIIVGIDNAGANRLNEYGPWKTTTGSTPETRNAGGLGRNMPNGWWKRLNPLLIFTIAPSLSKNIPYWQAVQWVALSPLIWAAATHIFSGI